MPLPEKIFPEDRASHFFNIGAMPMSTGGVEISFLQFQSSIAGIACNRVNHTAQVWLSDGSAALWLNGAGSAVRRLIKLMRQVDDDVHSIAIFDAGNIYLGKLVANAEMQWRLQAGPGMREIEAQQEKRRIYRAGVAAWNQGAEDEPESLPVASLALPAGDEVGSGWRAAW